MKTESDQWNETHVVLSVCLVIFSALITAPDFTEWMTK